MTALYIVFGVMTIASFWLLWNICCWQLKDIVGYREKLYVPSTDKH